MGVTKFVWDPVFDCVTHELDENNDIEAVYHDEPQQYGGVLSSPQPATRNHLSLPSSRRPRFHPHPYRQLRQR